MTEYLREHRNGIIGTITFHIVILVLMLLFGFFTPLPLPGEQGILVNFGDSETGWGETEPSPSVAQEEPTTVKEEITAAPEPVPAVTQPVKPAKEEVMTQNYEQTAAVEAARKKREEERQKQLELEKQRQAELERERIEAEARKKQEEERRRIAEIENRTKGAFGTPKTGTGTGSGTGSSQGVSYPGGNQGVPTGDPGSDNYGQGGRGSGTSGTGISYSLSGRTATSTPKPSYPGREEGTVVVKITVDKNGKVTLAEPGQRGSTTMNPDLLDAARRAALQARFNVDQNAPAFQSGTITYRFIQSQ